MATPTRFTSGLSQDNKWQPLGEVGLPDPFFYASMWDEFLPYNAALYTTSFTGGGAGTVTPNAANSGTITILTNATYPSSIGWQSTTNGFQYTPGKKLIFLARLSSTVALNYIALTFGLANGPASITDGIYFNSPGGSTAINLNLETGNVSIASTPTVALPTQTSLDFGFVIDRRGNTQIYFGQNLVGAQRENTAQAQPYATIPASSLTGAITTALLTPFVNIANTGAGTRGITLDFIYAAQER